MAFNHRGREDRDPPTLVRGGRERERSGRNSSEISICDCNKEFFDQPREKATKYNKDYNMIKKKKGVLIFSILSAIDRGPLERNTHGGHSINLLNFI